MFEAMPRQVLTGVNKASKHNKILAY